MGRRAPGRADHESRLRPSYPPANRDGGYGLGGWPELAPAENLTAGAAAPVYVNQNTPRAGPALWCFSVHRESELSSRRARPSALLDSAWLWRPADNPNSKQPPRTA